MATKRLFFALWPDDRQRDSLRNTITPVAKLVEGSAVYRGNWHVTLAYIGEFEESLIPALLQAARSLPFEPFRLRFDRAEFWPRPKIAVLAAQTVPPALERLVEALKVLLVTADVAVEDRMYRPHITIVKNARPFETQRLSQAAVVEWSGFELIESERSHGQTVYRPIRIDD